MYDNGYYTLTQSQREEFYEQKAREEAAADRQIKMIKIVVSVVTAIAIVALVLMGIFLPPQVFGTILAVLLVLAALAIGCAALVWFRMFVGIMMLVSGIRYATLTLSDQNPEVGLAFRLSGGVFGLLVGLIGVALMASAKRDW